MSNTKMHIIVSLRTAVWDVFMHDSADNDNLGFSKKEKLKKILLYVKSHINLYIRRLGTLIPFYYEKNTSA